MAHPDLGDEGDPRRQFVELTGQQRPVDLALTDLRALTIDPLGVDDVQVVTERGQRLDVLTERTLVEVRGQLRMRNVQGEPLPVLGDELGGVLQPHEQVVVLLAAHQPGVRNRRR